MRIFHSVGSMMGKNLKGVGGKGGVEDEGKNRREEEARGRRSGALKAVYRTPSTEDTSKGSAKKERMQLKGKENLAHVKGETKPK